MLGWVFVSCTAVYPTNINSNTQFFWFKNKIKHVLWWNSIDFCNIFVLWIWTDKNIPLTSKDKFLFFCSKCQWISPKYSFITIFFLQCCFVEWLRLKHQIIYIGHFAFQLSEFSLVLVKPLFESSSHVWCGMIIS